MKHSDALQLELLQEKAWNLGRLARRLERALEALSDFDGKSSGAPPPDHRVTRRQELIADAAEALFLYVVQRDVMGLRGTAVVLDELRVPTEVRLRMAPRSVLRRALQSAADASLTADAPPPERPKGNTA